MGPAAEILRGFDDSADKALDDFDTDLAQWTNVSRPCVILKVVDNR